MKNYLHKNIYTVVLVSIILLGVLFRTFSFAYSDTFEDDECRLLSAILSTNWLGLFGVLDKVQSAPPLFLVLIKSFGYLLGFSEKVLKFIPYFCSCVSLFLFYKLCTKILNNRISIICAMLLLAINSKIIHFAAVIKQYSVDIMIGLLCLLILPKIDITKLSTKKLIVLALILFLLPFISLPSLFFIGGFFLYNLFENLKNKNICKKLCLSLAPLICIMPVYYILNLAPSKTNFLTHFPGYWDFGFIKYNFSNILNVLTYHFRFDFYPNEYTLFEILLACYGVFLLIKTKNTISKYILLVLILILLASYLHLYPWCGRVSLYSTPIIIILCSKTLDTINLKKWQSYIIILAFFISFGGYTPKFLTNYFQENFYITYSSKSLIKTLKNKYNPNTDVILCNEASSSSFLFYSGLANLNTDEVYQIPDVEFLKTLKPGQRYWFYIVKDFLNAPNKEKILEFTETEDKIFEEKERDSYLILIRKK